MTYQIRSGDTLSALAQRFGTSVQSLAQANGIQNVNLIISGAGLKIPGASDSFAASGGGAPGSAPSGGPSGGSLNPADFGSRAEHLAAVARVTGGALGTSGWCAKGVMDSLEAAGLGVPRVASAYMAADNFARDSRFREVNLSPEQIRNLPPGAIIVSPSNYGGYGSPHGHITVTLGNGQEASDHVQNLIVAPGQRVFIPIG